MMEILFFWILPKSREFCETFQRSFPVEHQASSPTFSKINQVRILFTKSCKQKFYSIFLKTSTLNLKRKIQGKSRENENKVVK